MTSRFARIGAGVVLAVGLAVPAAQAQTQTRIEKIPLQYIDVRILAAALGAPVLPNEVELAGQRLPGGIPYGYGSYGGGGYGYAQLNRLTSSAYPSAY
jgi:hypothetical protein